MSRLSERHPFLDDLTENVTLVSSVLRGEISGRENVLKVVKAGAAQYKRQTPTFLADVEDRRLFEYEIELEGGLIAQGMVSIVHDVDGGVIHLHIAFSPLDAVLKIAKGVRELISGDLHPDLLL